VPTLGGNPSRRRFALPRFPRRHQEPPTLEPPLRDPSGAAAEPRVPAAERMPPIPEGQGARGRPRREPIGAVLVRMGLVTTQDVEEALVDQRETGRRIGETLVAEGKITREQLGQALALRSGVDYYDISTGLDPALTSLIDEKSARRLKAVPVRMEKDGRLVVAMADPSNLLALDDLRILTGREIVPTLALPEEIDSILGGTSRLDAVVADLVDEEMSDPVAEALGELVDAADDAPVVRLVNQLIARAVEERASDIHFEPGATEMTVRYRVDGVLRAATAVPMRMAVGVASRIKIMADLDIAEKRVPQDGRVSLSVGGVPLDLRVASLPTVHGEKIVIRILDKSNVMLRLTDLGFAPDVLRMFEASYRRPYGGVLVTGPTGSGKTTTLYGALNQLNTTERNIITVEDPVEYRLAGINQVQVNNRAGLTFAAGLRSILRCDPDVVMIGEVRDRETAQIAVEAALTGHMVLATLHTNDSAGALTRLTEMGVEPFLSANAIVGVLAQRLARRLCTACKVAETITPELLRESAGVSPLPAGLPEPITIYRAAGCPQCGNSGYKGRTGVYEMLVVSEAIERLAVEGASGELIARQARREGMRTLREDGLLKVLGGQTSLEELARAVG
jgi:type IV pilus assembly protein PilB